MTHNTAGMLLTGTATNARVGGSSNRRKPPRRKAAASPDIVWLCQRLIAKPLVYRRVDTEGAPVSPLGCLG